MTGKDTICATPIYPRSQTIPASPTVEPILSSGPSNRYWPMFVGTESQGEGKSCVGEESRGGEVALSAQSLRFSQPFPPQKNPSEWSGQLLLGLEALNASKNPELSEDERIQELMVGSKLIERAFNSNQRNASAANALCDIFLRKGQHRRVR
jgi:hypothetical protein